MSDKTQWLGFRKQGFPNKYYEGVTFNGTSYLPKEAKFNPWTGKVRIKIHKQYPKLSGQAIEQRIMPVQELGHFLSGAKDVRFQEYGANLGTFEFFRTGINHVGVKNPDGPLFYLNLNTCPRSTPPKPSDVPTENLPDSFLIVPYVFSSFDFFTIFTSLFTHGSQNKTYGRTNTHSLLGALFY